MTNSFKINSLSCINDLLANIIINLYIDLLLEDP